MAQYVVIIRKAPGTDYWVDAPDIPGCISRGTTTDEARKNFAEALLFHFESGENMNALIRSPPRTLRQLSEEVVEDSVETYLIEI